MQIVMQFLGQFNVIIEFKKCAVHGYLNRNQLVYSSGEWPHIESSPNAILEISH